MKREIQIKIEYGTAIGPCKSPIKKKKKVANHSGPDYVNR